MAKVVDTRKLINRYESMLALQLEIYKKWNHWFPPTTRELMDKWKLHTTSAVDATLKHLLGYEGLLAFKERNEGGTYVYFAVVSLKDATEIINGEKE